MKNTGLTPEQQAFLDKQMEGARERNSIEISDVEMEAFVANIEESLAAQQGNTGMGGPAREVEDGAVALLYEVDGRGVGRDPEEIVRTYIYL